MNTNTNTINCSKGAARGMAFIQAVTVRYRPHRCGIYLVS